MSNKERFTNGEWIIIQTEPLVCSWSFDFEKMGLGDAIESEEFDANAHLIAQSPNLYHALDESTKCMEIMLESLERNGYDTSGIEIQLEKNKAVISAALGE